MHFTERNIQSYWGLPSWLIKMAGITVYTDDDTLHE